MNLPALLHTLVGRGGSDIHLKAGNPPTMRFNGKLVRLEYSPLTEQDCEEVLSDLLSDREAEIFAECKQVDVSYHIVNLSRFRVNISRQQGNVRIVFRLIPLEVPTIDSMGLPQMLKTICEERRGLALVTGPTGAGKSTTMAAMVTEINRNSAKHIVTIEDPIEFVHEDLEGLVTQRQIGTDADSFADALRVVVRQDPDVILVGEMRDAETVFAAMSAAETGHLVLSTLHTGTAVDTLNRITDFFPPSQHRLVRVQFASCLRAVVSQRLVARKDGNGRLAAVEILIGTPSVKDRILQGAAGSDIVQLMKDGRTQYGMQTFDQHLYELWENEIISEKVALDNSTSPRDLSLRLRGLIEN